VTEQIKCIALKVVHTDGNSDTINLLLTISLLFSGIMWPHLGSGYATTPLGSGYASQHIRCLSKARIKWEGCDRKGIRRKNGGMMEVGH